MKIGFIGQGFIGKNYADDFEERGYSVTRYSLEPAYAANKDAISTCDVVFIAVPTPTTPQGFDASVVEAVLPLVGAGKMAVIKSTLLPGTLERLQAERPGIHLFHSPEFLRERTAAEDARKPDRNIIGPAIWDEEHQEMCRTILSILPQAPYEKICTAREAELIKYFGNSFLTAKVVFVNAMYDLAAKLGTDWDTVAEAVGNDPRIGRSHMQPVHESGRGAGGHCFIKDFEALLRLYADSIGDPEGNALFEAIRAKNMKLLSESGKDQDIVRGVYGS